MNNATLLKRWLLHVCTLLSYCTAAQQPVLRHYSADDGLPSSETYCVIQDNKGYMWFGTDRGIVKFDGYTFRTFSTADGLPDNTVFFLNQDSSGRIWFQPFSSRVGYLYNDTPFPYKYNAQVKAFLHGEVIDGMIVQENSDLWLSGRKKKGALDVLRIAASGTIDTLMNETRFRDIYLYGGKRCVSAGRIESDQIRVFSAETRQLLFTFPCGDATDYRAFFCRKGNTICLYASGRLVCWENGGCRTLSYGKADVLSMDFDKDNNLCVGYLHKGVKIYEAKTGYQTSRHLLDGTSVTGLACDREGGQWFTTLEDGVYYLPPGFSYSFSTATGLPLPKVLRIENIKGDVAMVSSDGDLAIKRKGVDRPEKVNTGGGTVVDIYYDSLLDRVFATGKPFKLPYQRVAWMGGDKKIYATPRTKWTFSISTISDHGADGTFEKQIKIDADRVTSLLETGDDDFLVGTVEGLYEFKDRRAVIALKDYNPLFNSRIADIKRLGNSHVAVATIGRGLLIIKDNDYRHPVQYGIKEGLPGMMCNVLLCDDATLWVGTNKGLCRIDNILDPVRQKMYVADSRNGLISNEINDICTVGNDLWIATMNGVSVLPRSATGGVKEIPIYIEQVLVNGAPLNMKQRSTLAHDHNNINISFSGVSYEHAGKLQYKYRLKGADENWNLTPNRTVIYNALSPGDYTFEVIVIGPGGQTSPSVKTYSFIISPPFWNTWWFIGLAGAIVTAGIYGFVNYRIQAVRKQAHIRNDLNRYRERALRSQMNPHFIYNAMNSIQNFIRKEESDRSIDLLTRFSSLMRLTFNNSGVQLISLQSDLDALSLYVEMEMLRFPDKFTLQSTVDENINTTTTFVPPFLIQPFIENAILHGFATKEGPGTIWLTICKECDKIKISIKDDGIGRGKAAEIRKRKEKYVPATDRKDSGVTVTASRIVQAWGRNVFGDVFKTIDLYDSGSIASGTLVHFYLPLNYDKSYSG